MKNRSHLETSSSESEKHVQHVGQCWWRTKRSDTRRRRNLNHYSSTKMKKLDVSTFSQYWHQVDLKNQVYVCVTGTTNSSFQQEVPQKKKEKQWQLLKAAESQPFEPTRVIFLHYNRSVLSFSFSEIQPITGSTNRRHLLGLALGQSCSHVGKTDAASLLPPTGSCTCIRTLLSQRRSSLSGLADAKKLEMFNWTVWEVKPAGRKLLVLQHRFEKNTD